MPPGSKTPPDASMSNPLIGILMGSTSDWPVMGQAARVLEEFGVSYEAKAISAHRAPDALAEYAKSAAGRGLQALIAGAGSAAHLPGVTAAMTTLPVLGVPIDAGHLGGVDALLSIVQMPGGIPVLTLGIGKAGAKNAGLAAVAILALKDDTLRSKLEAFRARQTAAVLAAELPPLPNA